ncbi:hypothetical protein ACPOM7_15225 [Peribacillus castrilensis]|uniref:Uncharacterized protein n=1 Tax=Peribacillus simplex TaxID=1478 RepID=A0AAN2PHZ4_9BACI|nr:MULTISPECIES: hypothetical protein [Bacillaceae]MCF7620484.1 hypothetical protein [Peribacillus frigoritolerans]MCP1156038.1 hypothetical protein [Peribacillus frigoritolerans]MCT1391871.1 hypothetical protein [Peribacillus frigoritolerans]PAL11268.1 hypothetical protein B8W99_17230 [Peribacillus simplex]CEG33045.1 hypothetical protein BN1180_03217 [Peribacillus simplex]
MDQQEKTIEKQSELIRVLVEPLTENLNMKKNEIKGLKRLDKIVAEVSAAVIKMAKEEVESIKKEVAVAKAEIDVVMNRDKVDCPT